VQVVSNISGTCLISILEVSFFFPGAPLPRSPRNRAQNEKGRRSIFGNCIPNDLWFDTFATQRERQLQACVTFGYRTSGVSNMARAPWRPLLSALATIPIQYF
jgi:hypothetical protein